MRGVTGPVPSSPAASTGPELALRRSLHRRGLRFRKDVRVATAAHSVRVDVAFPALRLAIFVDGCFWHSCPEHASVPKANADYWIPKLAENVARDRRNDLDLSEAGWTVVRLWEHESVDAMATRVGDCVDQLRSRSPVLRTRP